MKQILSLFITSLALCTACTSPKGSDTVQVAETTTEQTIQKASSAIHYNAFSHNDYWRERPLLDALSFRFNCVEADLWLIDGELYVSHDRPEPNPAIIVLFPMTPGTPPRPLPSRTYTSSRSWPAYKRMEVRSIPIAIVLST